MHGTLPKDNNVNDAKILYSKELDASTVPNLHGRNQNTNFADSTLVESNNNNTIVDNKEEDKILCAKTKKKSETGFGKFPDGFFARCRTRYEVWREVNGLQPEYFSPKEIGSLRNLINAVAYGIRTLDADGKPMATNYEDVYNAFDTFLATMPARYLQASPTITIARLYSSYNDITAAHAQHTVLYSPSVEAVVQAFTIATQLQSDYIATHAERVAAVELMQLLKASAGQKNPAAPVATDEQLVKWAANLFRKIATLEWWAQRTGSIGFVVKNYNSLAKAISAASLSKSPAHPTALASGKIIAAYGTEISWKNPRAAALFNINN